MRIWRILPACLLVLAVSACEATRPGGNELNDGDSLPAPKTLGVNAYIWQASLDTLGFLPLLSTDPFGGVIISDWYAPSSSLSERIKVTVHIMDRGLRGEGLKVKVFRQERIGTDWRDTSTNPATAQTLEDAILTRARELSHPSSSRA